MAEKGDSESYEALGCWGEPRILLLWRHSSVATIGQGRKGVGL